MTRSTLRRDLALLAHIVDAETPDVQELFQYALTMLLIEDGKAQIVERRKIDCREWPTVLTVAGELFDTVRPDVHRTEFSLPHYAALQSQAGCSRSTE